MAMDSFIIRPLLGLKNDVPQNDRALFSYRDNGAWTYAVDGENFDLNRKRHACSKSYGYVLWSNTANAQATKTLGLFELYDSPTAKRDYIICDNGKVYVYDGSKDPVDVSGAVTLATGQEDIYSMVKVGKHVVIADRAETTPYCWKNGDAAISKAISAGTEFKFRYLLYWSSHLIGLYSDQANGNIDVRWTAVLPVPGTTCEFAAANQLYVPTGDPIMGAASMGYSRAFIYCENSITQIVYMADYDTPFYLQTVVTNQGCGAPHSIVSAGNVHYLFNKNLGFCRYDGGTEFPSGGAPISYDIENHIQNIAATAWDKIVGKYIPFMRKIAWLVPSSSASAPDKIFFYDPLFGNWTVESIAARYIDVWQLSTYTSVQTLATLLGANITDLDPYNKSFGYYNTGADKLVLSNTNGHTYYHGSDAHNATDYTGFRVEPILDFGDQKTFKKLKEIWFQFTTSANFNIQLLWRGGNTVGEVIGASWEPIGVLSHNSPRNPMVWLDKVARLHQLKWQSTSQNEAFGVSQIVFKYTKETEF